MWATALSVICGSLQIPSPLRETSGLRIERFSRSRVRWNMNRPAHARSANTTEACIYE
jgi:hypothetical protein